MKPVRKFSANEGDYSTGFGSPDMMEVDIDTINKMFDPSKTHANGEGGGIRTENLHTEIKTVLDSIGGFSASITALQNDKLDKITFNDHKTSTQTQHNATAISNAPSGGVQATTVQGAINELDAEKLNVTEVVATPQPNKVLRVDGNSKLPTTVTGDAEATVAKLETHKGSSDHDGRYYTKTNVQTAGQASIHWDNITNVPSFGDQRWKQPVANFASLPPSGNVDGDLRIVLDTDIVYTWDQPTNQWKTIGASGNGVSSHSQMTNLNADDHPQYLRTDGTRTLTGNLDFNGNRALRMGEEYGASFPDTPVLYQRFFNTTLGRSYIYQGALDGWVEVSGRGAFMKREYFTANINGVQTFTLTQGKYLTEQDCLVVFVDGRVVNHTEIANDQFSVSVTSGQPVMAWYFQNAPYIVDKNATRYGNYAIEFNPDTNALDFKYYSS